MQWNPSLLPLAAPESSEYPLANNFSSVWSSINASFGACNFTGNCTNDGPMAILKVSILELVICCIVLGVLILCTLIGNVFVIAAVVLERNLHNVANYLIVSLAVADLMVAGLVMPISALNEMTSIWILGPYVCDMWVSFDVLCCTASILHLVAIALDRFWAITNIDYAAKRTAKRIIWMIVIVWVTAIVVSITPLFGWKSAEETENSCQITQDIGYTLFSTLCAFYIPLMAMGVIYWKIFQAAKFRIRKKAERGARRHMVDKKLSPSANEAPSQFRMESNTVIMKERNSSIAEENTAGPLLAETSLTQGNSNGLPAPSSDADTVSGSVSPTERLVPVPLQPTPVSQVATTKNVKSRFKIDIKRERKAAKTLGIVMGVFTICWLPFFIHALIAPICKDNCPFPQPLVSIFVWLGYVNSLLNPVIYTIFSPDFREAFKKILSYRSRRRRAHF